MPLQKKLKDVFIVLMKRLPFKLFSKLTAVGNFKTEEM